MISSVNVFAPDAIRAYLGRHYHWASQHGGGRGRRGRPPRAASLWRSRLLADLSPARRRCCCRRRGAHSSYPWRRSWRIDADSDQVHIVLSASPRPATAIQRCASTRCRSCLEPCSGGGMSSRLFQEVREKPRPLPTAIVFLRTRPSRRLRPVRHLVPATAPEDVGGAGRGHRSTVILSGGARRQRGRGGARPGAAEGRAWSPEPGERHGGRARADGAAGAWLFGRGDPARWRPWSRRLDAVSLADRARRPRQLAARRRSHCRRPSSAVGELAHCGCLARHAGASCLTHLMALFRFASRPSPAIGRPS
jgi:hypothetical protein